MKMVNRFFFVLLLSMSSIFAHANQNQPLLDLAEEFVAAINADSYVAINARFDKKGFGDAVIKNMNVSGNDANRIRREIESGINMRTIIGNGLHGMDRNTLLLKVIGVVQDKREYFPVVRISFPDGGTNYYELRTIKIGGKYFIQDVFIRSNGQFISETIAQTLAMMLELPSGWIATFTSDEKSLKKVNEQFKLIMAARKQNDFQLVYTHFQALPDEVKSTEVIQMMMVMAAANLDEKIYRRELSSFARRYGSNPRYYFMLIDHYFFTQEYEKSQFAIQKMLERYPGDASILNIQAATYIQQKEYQKAEQSIEAGLKSEPDFDGLYWTAVTSNLTRRDYVKTIQWLKKYEEQFDYEFMADSFSSEAIYAEFIESKEFKNWMNVN